MIVFVNYCKYLALWLPLIQHTVGFFFVPPFDLCKLTQTGTEYVGKVSQTVSNTPCQQWTSPYPHVVDSSIDDLSFPDGNMKDSRNHCRNPDNSTGGPWCYTTDPKIEREACIVPTCSNVKCRWTGPGVEYSGKQRMTLNENECLPWSTSGSLFDDLNNLDGVFPEGNRMVAARGCRNPTGDIGGPWCIVSSSDVDFNEKPIFIKEYCDIPFCFSHDDVSILGTSSNEFYSHFSEITQNSDGLSVDFSFKLWNPNQWTKAYIKIALSALAVPVTGRLLRDWSSGFEIVLKNVGSHVLAKYDEETDESLLTIGGIVNGLDWTNLTISWSAGHISVSRRGNSKPLFLLEVNEPIGSLVNRQGYGIKYVSFLTNAHVMFNTEIPVAIEISTEGHKQVETSKEESCIEHVTNYLDPVRFFYLRKVGLGPNRDLLVHFRSTKKTRIVLQASPVTMYPHIALEFGELFNISIQQSPDSGILLESIKMSDIVSFWKWASIDVALTGRRFQLFLISDVKSHKVFDLTNGIFASIRWFGFGSDGQAFWTLYCQPRKNKELVPIPPECSVSELDLEYIGHQAISSSGRACIPWVAKDASKISTYDMVDGSKEASINYCRNPTLDQAGTFCYTLELTETNEAIPESCKIRKCTFEDCKIAGTGDDFSGTLSKTRMNLTCQKWSMNYPHKIGPTYQKDEYFPERSVRNASNYCRNPKGDVAGPWCFTNNPKVKKDLCNVPDCHEPEACIVLATGHTMKKMLIIPQWKVDGFKFKAKNWNPSEFSELSFTFYPKKGNRRLTFVIGAENNEFLKLIFYNETNHTALLKQKAWPHFLSSGKWTSVIINIRTGQFDAKFEEARDPFLSWTFSPEGIYFEGLEEIQSQRITVEPFPPAYFSYSGGVSNRYVGMSFPCHDCHSIFEGTSTNGTVIYPVNLWLNGTRLPVENIRFYLRGSGTTVLSFYALPSTEIPDLRIHLNEGTGRNVYQVDMKYNFILLDMVKETLQGQLFSNKEWTQFDIGLDMKKGYLKRNDKQLDKWDFGPNAAGIYYFTVDVKGGDVYWTVNCLPPDIDGPQVDGGWSEWSSWSCSATCGGGKGSRTRSCSKPKPSVFGEPCYGESIMAGPCNTFPCGSVSPFSLEYIQDQLRSYSVNKMVKPGESFEVKCNPQALARLKKEDGSARMYWTRNGFKISPDIKLGEIEFEDRYELAVIGANHNHTGVYACILTTSTGIYTPLAITAVTVVSKEPSIVKSIGDRLIFNTNAQLLGRVYEHVTLKWKLNGKIVRSYDVDVKTIAQEVFKKIDKKDEGVWECVVSQRDLQLEWITSWYYLEVRKKSTLATHMMEDRFTRPIFGYFKSESIVWIVLVCLYLLVMLLVFGVVYFIIKMRRNRQKIRETRSEEHLELLRSEEETEEESDLRAVEEEGQELTRKRQFRRNQESSSRV